jgi:hypothetical protein
VEFSKVSPLDLHQGLSHQLSPQISARSIDSPQLCLAFTPNFAISNNLVILAATRPTVIINIRQKQLSLVGKTSILSRWHERWLWAFQEKP